MDAAAFVELGRVARTHGLAGEVSVVMTVDLPVARLVGVPVWFVPPTVAVRASRIVSVRPGPKGPLVAFEGVGDIGTAEQLRDRTVLACPSDLPEFEEPFDPVGLRVVDAERGEIGTVRTIIVTGANDVWVVQGRFGEVLIPDIPDVIKEIDEESGIASVVLLPGLID